MQLQLTWILPSSSSISAISAISAISSISAGYRVINLKIINHLPMTFFATHVYIPVWLGLTESITKRKGGPGSVGVFTIT